MRRWIVLVASVLLLSAGCLGGRGPDAGTSGEEAGAPGGETVGPGGNATASNASAATNGSTEADGPVVHVFNGSVNGASQGQVSPTPCASSGCEHQWPFELDENATGIVAEAIWNASDELRLSLWVPNEHCETTNVTGIVAVVDACDNPEPYEGPSPARIDVTSEQRLGYTGEWTADVRASQSAEEVPFTVYISVFYDQTPPTDHSALPGT